MFGEMEFCFSLAVFKLLDLNLGGGTGGGGGWLQFSKISCKSRVIKLVVNSDYQLQNNWIGMIMELTHIMQAPLSDQGQLI